MTERKPAPATADELARSLLASARLDERPLPDKVRHGMLAALGAAGAITTTTAAAAATSGALRRLILVKWLAGTAIVATAGAGVYATVVARQSPSATVDHASPPHTVPIAAAPVAVPPTPAASAVPPAAQEHDSAAAPAEPHAARPRTSVSSATETSSLEGEVAALDRARAALGSGNPAHALELLDAYEHAFAKGSLRPEATYLRIQALSKAGQRAAARELAARFLASHPSSPHAAQLQALISQ